MKVVGLIAEYNPFHNGHQFHIEQAKMLTGADYAVVVMSGDFVQRGEPAIMPKHLRAKSALHCGADLVIELPVSYATGSAEQFAFGAVSMLEKLGIIDTVCFGSECGDIAILSDIAGILTNESDEYKSSLQKHLRTGVSFPVAREMAIKELFPDKNYDQILGQPNNILGIEYIKALFKSNSNIKPYTITRKGSSYHDNALSQTFSSATAIRLAIDTEELKHIHFQIPAATFDMMQKEYKKSFPIYPNDFSLLLKYRLLNETKESLCDYADVSEELANRIVNRRNEFIAFEQFCELLKTKELTYARISRALIHILLKCKKNDISDISYARVLGFRTDSTEVMSEIKKCGRISLVTKLANFKHPLLERDIYASYIYQSVVTEKFKTSFQNEYEHPLVRI